MPGEAELPPGWTAHKDPDTGFTYYFHAATGESRWEKPVAPPAGAAVPPSPPAGAPTQAQQLAAATIAATVAAHAGGAAGGVAAAAAGPAAASGAGATPAGGLQQQHKARGEGVRNLLGLGLPPRAGPMWENEAFVDVFLDGYNAHRRHGIAKGMAQAAVGVLVPALQAVADECAESSVLRDALDSDGRAALGGLAALVQDFYDICRGLPARTKSEQQCLELVHAIITRIKALAIGAAMMVPGGWAAAAAAEDFAFVFVVERVSTDKLTVGVCNTGPDGLGYHAIKADVSASANMLYRMSLLFEDVPDARLCDSAFWFLTARMHVWPGEGHNAQMLYEQLLPGLNQRTLAATQALNSEDALRTTAWRVPPQGGDASMVHCVLDACELYLFT